MKKYKSFSFTIYKNDFRNNSVVFVRLLKGPNRNQGIHQVSFFIIKSGSMAYKYIRFAARYRSAGVIFG